MKKIAVLLSGCGVFDGSEIHEAVSVLYHIAKNGAKYECFAPNRDQMHVINHFNGKEIENEKRNILFESARIARGEIKELKNLSSGDFDAVILPGGFGAAKNLCDFAIKGEEFKIYQDVEKILQDFHKESKPMGFACISPVIGAKLFNSFVTIGTDEDVSKIIEKVGGVNVPVESTEVVADPVHKMVSTPAYMDPSANIVTIFEGIGKMVSKVLSMI